jgi:hypothetical protein
MPSTGTPSSNTTCGARGVSSSYTEDGPPERMMPAWREIADELLGDVVGMQLAIDAGLAHAARDQLGVLGTEVEDEDFLVHAGWSGGSVG